MNRFAITANMVVRCFLVFIIAFLWASYLFRGLFLTFVVAFLITALCNFLWMFFINRRKQQRTQTRAERDHMMAVILQLQFLTPDECVKLFDSVQRDDIVLFPFFHRDITRQDIITAIRATPHGKKTVVMAMDFPPHLRAFFESLQIDLCMLTAEDAYKSILKPAGSIPPLTVTQRSRARMTVQTLRNDALTRRKARGYVMIGVIIMLTSIIVRPTLFYVIFGTVVFGLALVSYLRPVSKNDIF